MSKSMLSRRYAPFFLAVRAENVVNIRTKQPTPMQKIAKKLKESLLKEYEKIMAKSKSSASVIVLDIGCMNTRHIQILRAELKPYGTLIKSKRKAMLRALKAYGSLACDLTEKAHLFFVEQDLEAVLSLVKNFSATGFLKAGDVAPVSLFIHRGVIKAQDVPVPVLNAGKLTDCGIPVSVEDDVLLLKEEVCISNKGDVVNPKLAEILKILKIAPRVHKVKILSVMQKSGN